MDIENSSPSAIAEELGRRLKQARLNNNLTQSDIADQAGISRKSVINAEKGKAQLEVFVAILAALKLTAQLTNFLPEQGISPVQLSKLHRKKRQRASGQRVKDEQEDHSEW